MENKPAGISPGEIWGKQSASKFVLYSVLKVRKDSVTLQNVDNPLSLFDTTLKKLHSAGYLRISQTPFIDTNPAATSGKKRKAASRKPTRCPYTLDFLESRADNERPQPIIADMFA